MLWKDEACPEIEKTAEIKDPRFKSISTQVTEGAEDEEDEINSEESNISSNSNEDEDDEINSEESSISSDSNEDGWETFSNESDSIETENEENVNDVGLTDEENSSIEKNNAKKDTTNRRGPTITNRRQRLTDEENSNLEKNNAEKETTKVNANKKEKGLHTGRKSTIKVLFLKKMESPSRSESSTESADIRRVEFEDGRVVHLPNNMPDKRVREVRSSQQDLQFYHRYNAGDVCLGPGEDHWEALGRRSELSKKRSPLNWNVPDQEQQHFNYEPVGAIEREVEREEEYEGYGIPLVRRIQDVNNHQREEDDGRVSPFVRWRREQIQGVNNEDAWGDEPDAWAIASPRRSPVDPHTEEWGMYWDQPAAPHLIDDLQPNWIQQGNVGRYNRSGLPAEDWEREEEGSPEN
ncbi:hypothetical protein DAPPUDRAFT_108399 [Daphnia pulex]|uniref:Uncharacterized protein n=1 Tax=Daphnia pulex TaxID=6669 RepID=E9H032_DAPPU|nr:hypothetical protein DAPPUDRAFT_108399 [Daphnia pulex]|eukprot:EFX74954.1 hypothetical protein DAPPUDRAFT_108399 [Daphnia pulex]